MVVEKMLFQKSEGVSLDVTKSSIEFGSPPKSSPEVLKPSVKMKFSLRDL